MSYQNKPEIKSERRSLRQNAVRLERRPASNISLDSITAVLGDPKGKLNRRNRRYLMAARANLLVMPEPTVRQTAAVKLALKLEKMPLARVIRRRAQFARYASKAKHLLAALSPDSHLRPGLQRAQDVNLFAFKAAQLEINARRLHPLDLVNSDEN